jgi:pantoate--beta-alanine ligase
LSRPHFFRGVATVVTKLFNIIQPDRAYFGQKDIQQTIVLKALIRDLHIPTNLIVCPTVRESDGLAVSSRNAYLDPSQRNDALILWHALKVGLDFYRAQPSTSASSIWRAAQDSMSKSVEESHGRISLEYLDLVDPESLYSLTDANVAAGAILVGAIRLRGPNRTIRLIDNVVLELTG